MCGAALEQPFVSCCLCPVYVVARPHPAQAWGAAMLYQFLVVLIWYQGRFVALAQGTCWQGVI